MDSIYLNKSELIAELIEIETDENCHGLNDDQSCNWNDGAKAEGYGNWIKERLKAENLPTDDKTINEVWNAVLEAI